MMAVHNNPNEIPNSIALFSMLRKSMLRALINLTDLQS